MAVSLLSILDGTSLGTSATTVLIFVVVFLFVFWARRPQDTSNLRLPPGPWAWPLLGNLPNLIAAGTEPHEMFLSLSQQYGPVLRIDLVGGKRIVVLHGYKAIYQAFNNPLLVDRPMSEVSQKISPGIGITLACGQKWKIMKNLMLRFMRDFSIGKSGFEGSIAKEVQSLIQEFKDMKGKPVKSISLFHGAISNIICSVLYGTRYDYDDPKFQELLRQSTRTFQLLGSGGILFFMPFANLVAPFIPSLREICQNFQKFNSFVDEALRWHREAFDPHSDPTDFLYVCLKSELRNRQISIGDLMAASGDLFYAGTETTTTTLQWSLLYMVANPEIQARVQQEIDAVVGRNRLPQMSDKPNLPYTEATILEVQRISSVVPLGVPHKAAEDTTLLGYTIPKGTILLPNMWALGRDPEVWPDPHLFKPERFLHKDGHVTRKDEFMPFSVGRRICVGEPLAKMELFLFFSGVLHQFTLHRPDGASPISFKGTAGFTLAPAPFEMRAIVRTS